MSDSNNNGSTNSFITRKNSTIPPEYLDAQFSIKPGRQKVFDISSLEDDGPRPKSPRKIIQKPIDMKDGEAVSNYFSEKLENSEFDIVSYEDQIFALLMANSEVISGAKIIGMLSETKIETPITQENDRKQRINYEEPTEDRKKLLKQFAITKSTKSSLSKGKGFQLSQPFVLPKFKSWRQIQKSYKLVPELPELGEKSSFLDFIGNDEFKSFFLWSHGSKIPDLLPFTLSEATLYMSQAIDLYSIDDTNTFREENKILSDKTKNIDQLVDNIVDKKVEQRKKLKRMMDIENETYYLLPDFEDALKSKIPPLPLQDISLVFSVMNITELNADVMQSTGNTLSYSLGKFIPFLKTSLSHPEAEYHIICPSQHVAFFYYLSHATNRIKEYLQRIDFIQTRLAFDVADEIGVRQLFISNAEASRFTNSVESGGYLSQPMRAVHCASVLHATTTNLAVYDNALDVMNGKTKHFSFLGFDGVPLYAVKFVQEDDFVNIIVSPYKQTKSATAVSPFYWPIMHKYTTHDADFLEYIAGSSELQFTINRVLDPKIDPPLSFVPGTTSFVFM
jgi:hypothetical protein